MKKYLKFLIWCFLVIALLLISIFTLLTFTSFSQSLNTQNSNLDKLSLPFLVNFSDKEIKYLNSLSQTDLDKLIKTIKLIIEKNKSASNNSKINQFFSRQNSVSTTGSSQTSQQPTTYSNTPSPQTPHFNPSTGQYQSTPPGNTSGQQQPTQQPQNLLQQLTQPTRDPRTGQITPSPLQKLAEEMTKPKDGTTPVGGENCGGSGTHIELKSVLDKLGVKIKSSGNCSNPNIKSCTSLENMPRKILLLIEEIKSKCGNCNITITGGTETGHMTHGFHKAIFDLGKDPGLDRFLNSIGKRLNGATFLDESPGQFHTTTGAHWHVNATGYACKK